MRGAVSSCFICCLTPMSGINHQFGRVQTRRLGNDPCFIVKKSVMRPLCCLSSLLVPYRGVSWLIVSAGFPTGFVASGIIRADAVCEPGGGCILVDGPRLVEEEGEDTADDGGCDVGETEQICRNDDRRDWYVHGGSEYCG